MTDRSGLTARTITAGERLGAALARQQEDKAADRRQSFRRADA